ncbi:MAG: Gfo/Idh/MocA family oxidoreductase [Puniceicoccales bacterium]|jgi:predicted dehydrogenase|nr:Gfo/Idh/MocA family oxidoreductase [Puniceicoccales bacterium]
MTTNYSRRTFLKYSTALAAGLSFPYIAKTFAAPGSSANETLNVGLIGCRNMGWGDLNAMLTHKGVRCVALCDVDDAVLAERKAALAKKYGQNVETFKDYRKLLERKDIDIVIIGTPDHWHCRQLVDACAAGKDVYVEKPLANSIAECEVMVNAAVHYNRVVQVGQQQRSHAHWHEMVDYLRSGELGKIGRVKAWANFDYAALHTPAPDSPVPAGVDYDLWLGPAPVRPFNQQRFHGSWRMFWNYGGGLLTDWGVHLLDMCLWGMDVKTLPLHTVAHGGKFLDPEGAHETFDTLSVAWQFKDFILEWENNATNNAPHGKNYGLFFRGSNGTLVADRGKWEVFPEGKKIPVKTARAKGDFYVNHTGNFLECVRTRNRATACSIENGSLCARYTHLGNISARVGNGTLLVYDEHKHQFNVPEANRFFKPDYRPQWEFPQVR